MRLQSAIFDMDGTLLDSMHIWNSLASDLLRSMGVEPAPDLGDRLMLMTFRDGAALCKEEYHLSETVEEIIELTKAEVNGLRAAAVKGRAQTRSAAHQTKAAERRPRGPVGKNVPRKQK